MKIRDTQDSFAAGVLIARLEDMASDSKAIRNKVSKWVIDKDNNVPMSFNWCCAMLDVDSTLYRQEFLGLSIEDLRTRLKEFIASKQEQEV